MVIVMVVMVTMGKSCKVVLTVGNNSRAGSFSICTPGIGNIPIEATKNMYNHLNLI